jgi:RNA polymerase sigma-70 factor (ECF subfamily)
VRTSSGCRGHDAGSPLSFAQHLTKLDGPNALAAWLYIVTRNRCHRRRRGPLQGNERKLSFDELIPDDEELTRLLLVADGGPERDAIQAERHHLLHEAVLRLPTPLRMVLVLQDMEELSSEDLISKFGLRDIAQDEQVA